MSANPLQQTIEALAKEKGIEPDVVISAIEEAVATASRKYYKTGENLKTRFNLETGQVDLFALKTVVEEVLTPATDISITEAGEMHRPLYGDDVARGKLYTRRSGAHGDQGREPQRKGPADRVVADRSGAAHQAVRAGSAGNLRRNRDDPWRGPGSGRPRESRRVLARARRGSG